MQSQTPKQYLSLLGQPILWHTLERLCGYAGLHGVLVGLAPDDRHWSALRIAGFKTLLGSFGGGAVRAATVLNGLDALAEKHATDEDWVMVHDAVRPCVRHADLGRLVAAALQSPDGALLALPVADTVKRADKNGMVQETVPRADLWRALTPQMFRVKKLRDALRSAVQSGEDITDESAAIERAGGRPVLVEGHPDNIKITHPTDLVLAELFLKRQAKEQA